MKRIIIVGLGVVLGLFLFLIISLAACSYLMDDNNTNDGITAKNLETDSKNIESTDKFKNSEKPTDSKEPTVIEAPFEVIHNRTGLEIIVNKIENDDMLKLYMTYKNNSGRPFSICDGLYSVIADSKQLEPNDAILDLNSDILYDIENGVNYDLIIPFDKINVDMFNLVVNVDYDDVRINNIRIP